MQLFLYNTVMFILHHHCHYYYYYCFTDFHKFYCRVTARK